MTIRVAINGYGRIGRAVLRALYEKELTETIQIVAINAFGQRDILAHLTQYDSIHGKFSESVSLVENGFQIRGSTIPLFSEPDPSHLPWSKLNVDVVFECTGKFTSREKASNHIKAGAKKVLISAPATDSDATIVYGVNHSILTSSHQIISNASCTTNCLATLIKPLHEQLGIEQGFMTTIHSYTNDQKLVDVYHSDFYRARSATQSMIPTKTGAASSIGLIFPELAGKLDGLSIRVPTPNVSLIDFNFRAARPSSVEEVNQILEKSANNELKNLLDYNDSPMVSIDFNHHSASAIIAARETRVLKDFIKVLAWYDNEWGFANRMLDVTKAWHIDVK